ncbi:zinc finger protein, putative [Plasmodium reichenowi]|uniref:Zinc finger protein, putative n=1 Tax=Plasmodium reichenowi TaxID=5854 RepID=A0A060RZZ4_PLARE|nr:zinc finger protein, putative [Plasmodium reichenowi]
MHRRNKEYTVRSNNKFDLLKNDDEKHVHSERNQKYSNISYHIRKLFSYCDADILRIENNLIIYNSLIDNIKKNGNKIIKKEVEKIIREKEKNEHYSLKEMNEEEYKVTNFDLKKVELDFKFIECSLCFELIKFICIQECNHTYCFLCFYRLLYMEKKENDNVNNEQNYPANNNYHNNNNNNISTSVNTSTSNTQRSYYRSNVSSSTSDFTFRDNNYNNDSYFNMDSRRSRNRRNDNKKEEIYKYEFDKVQMKCPFCKEHNEYIFICLNNFYTHFTYENLLNTLLEKEVEQSLMYASNEPVDLSEYTSRVKESTSEKKSSKGSNTKRSMDKNRKEEHNNKNKDNNCADKREHRKEDKYKDQNEDSTINNNNNNNNNNNCSSCVNTCIHVQNERTKESLLGNSDRHKDMNCKDDLKRIFSSYYDELIILRKILKKDTLLNNNTNNMKKVENMYLFFYYEKYVKWKKKRIKYLVTCINSQKRYAFFSKIFGDIEKKIFYEYFYIFSLCTLLTSYSCLVSPCIDYWTKIQNRKVEKYKLNHKDDKYFEQIYIKNEKILLRKKNDSIYDKYQQHTKNLFYISEEESEKSDDYFKVIDIFYKICFTNLDNINILSHLKNYSYKKLNELCRHMHEHNKTYCDICVGNNDNIFLFEYNIFYKRYIKVHIEYGEKIGDQKYQIRHIYCHLCNIYLYDFDTYMNHVNKYHFFCKFCFNKKPNQSKENIQNVIDDVVYYEELHLYVYKDYENLFEHYKKKHHPCLYEQCIFVVFDNKIDLCLHLAEKHEERGSNKKNKITLSIGGASYSEIRNNAINHQEQFYNNNNNNNNNNGYSFSSSYREKSKNKYTPNDNETNDLNGDDEDTDIIDPKEHKCIYNFRKFYDCWYFDYYIDCKIVDFLKYFFSMKPFFLYIIKEDINLILSVFENFSKLDNPLYFNQDEIIELNKNIILKDFLSIHNQHTKNKTHNTNNINHMKYNNIYDRNCKYNNTHSFTNLFFIVKLFFDYVVEKVEYLLYNKEDLERNYLYLFFQIIHNRSFILYYSFLFIYINQKGLNLEGSLNIMNNINNSTNKNNKSNNKNCSNSSNNYDKKDHIQNQKIQQEMCYRKNPHIYKCDDDMLKYKMLIENNCNVNLKYLSKYGFLYLIFLFFKIDKHTVQNVTTFIKQIFLLCNDIYRKDIHTKDVHASNVYINDIDKTNIYMNDIPTNQVKKFQSTNDIVIPLICNKNEKSKKFMLGGNFKKLENTTFLLEAIKEQQQQQKQQQQQQQLLLLQDKEEVEQKEKEECEYSELEDINQLIKKCLKRKNPNNNIITNIYDKKCDISKKVILDLLPYVQPKVDLVSFFYLFLSNYFSAYIKDENINKLINLSNINKKKILNKISADVDNISLTTISKDLAKFVNARTLEECLSTGPEYYRIRKDIENILKINNNNNNNNNYNNNNNNNNNNSCYNNYSVSFKNSVKNNHKENTNILINDVKNCSNVYDISLSLRNRFLNIIKSTKLNELYFIYFYVCTIMLSKGSSHKNVPTEEYPSLNYDNNNNISINNLSNNKCNLNTTNSVVNNNHNKNNRTSSIKTNRSNKTQGTKNTKTNINSYKNKVEMSKESYVNTKINNLDLEYPPLPLGDDKKEKLNEENDLLESSKNKKDKNKKKLPKEYSQILNKENTCSNKNLLDKIKNIDNKKNKNENNKCNLTTTKDTNNLFLDSNNYPSLISNEKTKKNVEKNNDKKKTKNNNSQKFNEDDFPLLQSTEDNKKNNNKNNHSHILSNEINNNKNIQNKKQNTSSKSKNEKNSCEQSSSSFPLNYQTYINSTESNVTYTIKKKNKVKRCNICTYDNPCERKKCELCDSVL